MQAACEAKDKIAEAAMQWLRRATVFLIERRPRRFQDGLTCT
jgi:hypothetical protein